jgi:hypothetical protein
VVGQFRGIYLAFLWVCVGLWCFDHVCRILRILIINWPRSNSKAQSALANARYIPSADIIRLTVPMARDVPVRPGTYYFLSLPNPGWRIWEQHPFSAVPTYNTLSDDGRICESSESTEKSLTFLIRPKNGMTARLRTQLLASSPPSRSLHVLLEGRYGSQPLRLLGRCQFSSILLIAGGTGITAIIPYLHSILNSCRQYGKDSSGIATSVRLVWIAREIEFIEDVLKHELRPLVQATHRQQDLGGGVAFDMQLFAMQGQETQCTMPSVSPSTSEKSSQIFSSPAIEQISDHSNDTVHEKETAIITGRPSHDTSPGMPNVAFVRPDISKDISAFCTQDVHRLSSSDWASSRIAILVSGPTRLAEEARHAVQEQTECRVEYFEESYEW